MFALTAFESLCYFIESLFGTLDAFSGCVFVASPKEVSVMNFLSFLQVSQAAAGSSQGSFMMTIVTFGLVFVIFYFFIIRPQNKKQKETEKMISALKKGDKVITIGGIHGEVSSTKENTVIVKVDENCKLEFSRSAISSVESPEKAAKAAKAEAEQKTEKASGFFKKAKTDSAETGSEKK